MSTSGARDSNFKLVKLVASVLVVRRLLALGGQVDSQVRLGMSPFHPIGAVQLLPLPPSASDKPGSARVVMPIRSTM